MQLIYLISLVSAAVIDQSLVTGLRNVGLDVHNGLPVHNVIEISNGAIINKAIRLTSIPEGKIQIINNGGKTRLTDPATLENFHPANLSPGEARFLGVDHVKSKTPVFHKTQHDINKSKLKKVAVASAVIVPVGTGGLVYAFNHKKKSTEAKPKTQ